MKNIFKFTMVLAVILLMVAPLSAQVWRSGVYTVDFSDDSTETASFYVFPPEGVYVDTTLQVHIYQASDDGTPHTKIEMYPIVSFGSTRNSAYAKNFTLVTLSADLSADSTLTTYRMEPAAADTAANESGVIVRPDGVRIDVTGLSTNRTDAVFKLQFVGKRDER